MHHHIPTFHTEHCVYAHLLSNGRDIRSCGQPCQDHEIGLRDGSELQLHNPADLPDVMKIAEIREAKRIHNCEYCGRILVWTEKSES